MLVGIRMLTSCFACHGEVEEEPETVFSVLRKQGFPVDSADVAETLQKLVSCDFIVSQSDRYTRDYYLQDGSQMLWLQPGGVSLQADELLKVLAEVSRHGLLPDMFLADTVAADLKRMRTLHFDSLDNSVGRVLIRLEYHLTKAYLRYYSGQRFGFSNPKRYLNRLDPFKEDTVSGKVLSYRGLFDVDIDRPDSLFFQNALQQIRDGHVGETLQRATPQSSFYRLLQQQLSAGKVSEKERQRLLVNMERCRWRGAVPPMDSSRHVVVNIPAFHLYAYGADSLIDMRVGCGTVKTKTPLLVSAIERMDVNPVWNIPPTIIKNEVAVHAGDTAYFERNRYYIVERSTGKRMSVGSVSARMLRSGLYRVTQEGGEGNALGRIIFRFPNNFSVFLHDTSSRQFFERNNRGVSHGCVRVERPFELAQYLWRETDEWKLDRLRISMGLDPQGERGKKYVEQEDYDDHLVSGVPVRPHVPLFITYFTLYPDSAGTLVTYPDVYGYDPVVYEEIKPFVEKNI